MRPLFTIVLIFIMSVKAFADEKADVKISYRFEYPNFKTCVRESKNNYILLSNAKESKFYSPQTEYIDSLKSTPEGMAKLNEITHGAYLSGKIHEAPRPDGSFYVIKSKAENKLTYYELVGMTRLYSEEEIPQLNWEISDSTRNILGYECNLATSELYGRKWNVWFTPEIPVMDGPWKLTGLPGLIIEAETDDRLYYFTVTGIQQTTEPIGSVYLADSYEKVSRKELLITKRAFFDNPLGNINSQLSGTSVKVIDENGNKVENTQRIFATREEVDFIETDY